MSKTTITHVPIHAELDALMTGIGPAPVKVPRIRDRKPGGDRITFKLDISAKIRRL